MSVGIWLLSGVILFFDWFFIIQFALAAFLLILQMSVRDRILGSVMDTDRFNSYVIYLIKRLIIACPKELMGFWGFGVLGFSELIS